MSYLGNAGQLLVGTLLSLAMLVFLLRVLLQAAGANFYNPICLALHKLTQPVIGPLRRVLPPLRRIELAGVLVVLLLALAKVAALSALGGAVPPLPALLLAALADAISLLLWVWFWTLLAGVLLSWIPVDNRHPVVPLVYQLTEPLLAPIRRLLPPMGLDLSPMIAMLGVALARILIVAPLADAAARLALGV